MHNSEIIEVLIVGGGPAGCATALSLDPSIPFVLVDDADSKLFKIGESLPPESTRLLHTLHPSLPHTVPPIALSCTGNASAWASSYLEERHAIMNPYGYGWHLDRAAFDQTLRDRTTEISIGDNPLRRTIRGKFKSVHRSENAKSWVITLQIAGGGEEVLKAKWIIDATGRKASVVIKLGAKTITPQPLLAFFGLFTCSPDPEQETPDSDHRTVIEAVPTGWFYTSLIPRHPGRTCRVVAYHTHPTHSSAKLVRRPAGFLDLLQCTSHISDIIQTHGYELEGGIKCTAAGSSYLDRPTFTYPDQENGIGGGWIAVGDAALAFDPLSAQGMMSALESGYFVGRILSGSLNGGLIDVEKSVEKMYQSTKDEYEERRRYYYTLVSGDGRGRFSEEGEEFWGRMI